MQDDQTLVVAAPAGPTGIAALALTGAHGSASAWFTYEAAPESAAPPSDPCSASISPTAPGQRIVVPFPAACGLESVVVQLPPGAQALQLAVEALPGLPPGVPRPDLATPPSFVFDVKLRNATGAEVEPAGAILQVRVPAAWLAGCPADRCRPALFHFHGEGWRDYDLATVDVEGETVVMQAEVQSFSVFAVAGAVVPAAATLPAWAWPVGGVLLVAPAAAYGAVRLRRRRRAQAAAATEPAEAPTDARVALLLKEMRDKEELLQFVNLAAHDLANPLTPIQLHLDLLQEAAKERQDSGQDQALEVVRSNVAQLEGLVKDLRDAAKLQSGKLRLAPEPMDLAALVQETVRSHTPTAASTGLRLMLDAPASLPLLGDPARLRRVLGNFLGNAIKFTPAGGHVRVQLSRGDRDAFLSVTDTGLGLTEEDRGRLFRPFSQVHGEKEKAKGTGLGLFIAKGIVEGHGGRIGCTSDGPGKGSTFFFTVPLPAGAEPATPPVGPDQPTPST
jgi:signal transduction histidine kinase